MLQLVECASDQVDILGLKFSHQNYTFDPVGLFWCDLVQNASPNNGGRMCQLHMTSPAKEWTEIGSFETVTAAVRWIIDIYPLLAAIDAY